MYQRKLKIEMRCPLEYGLNLFSGKWKARIIFVLAMKEKIRYNALRKELGDITDAVLATTLKELISDDLIVREQYSEIPPRVEYSLSHKGISALPVLMELCRWAARYMTQQEGPEFPHCEYCGHECNLNDYQRPH